MKYTKAIIAAILVGVSLISAVNAEEITKSDANKKEVDATPSELLA